jgi:hypothetical protein
VFCIAVLKMKRSYEIIVDEIDAKAVGYLPDGHGDWTPVALPRLELEDVENSERYEYYGAPTRGGNWRVYAIEKDDYIDLTKRCYECSYIYDRYRKWSNYDCIECMLEKLKLAVQIGHEKTGLIEIGELIADALADLYELD